MEGTMDAQEKYRRIMGSIYYDAGRMQAYSIIAKLASDTRRNNAKGNN
jgi:hypothetical protein